MIDAEDIKQAQGRLYCVDDRHGSPCPQPCGACREEGCDPPVSLHETLLAFPEESVAHLIEMGR